MPTLSYFDETMKALVVVDQSTGKILGDNMDDTLSKHTKADRNGEHNGKNTA